MNGDDGKIWIGPCFIQKFNKKGATTKDSSAAKSLLRSYKVHNPDFAQKMDEVHNIWLRTHTGPPKSLAEKEDYAALVEDYHRSVVCACVCVCVRARASACGCGFGCGCGWVCACVMGGWVCGCFIIREARMLGYAGERPRCG